MAKMEEDTDVEMESHHGPADDGEELKPFVDASSESPGKSNRPIASRIPRSKAIWAGVIIGVVVIAVVLGFVVGLLTGQSSSHGSSGSQEAVAQSCNQPIPTPLSTPRPSQTKGETSTSCNQPSPCPSPQPSQTLAWGADVNIDGEEVPVVEWLDGSLSKENMKEYLRDLTDKPHIAGGAQNKELAMQIYNEWKGYNFDEVELFNYTVLLSYPNHSNPNIIHIVNASGYVMYSARTAQEEPLTMGENDSSVVPPFNAYSGFGSASGPLVYVNYAQIEDFLYLTTNLSLNLTGYICIARYGRVFRGNKAQLAQQFGCAGLIIYSDPADYAPRDGPPVYPDGPMLPPGGVQRGSVMLLLGDPLTPGMPAIDGIYRRDFQDAIDEKEAPSIPVQPISYGDAIHFLSQLSKFHVPTEWVGELNLSYHIMQDENNTMSFYIQVNNYQEEQTIYDVTATIYGSVEPDDMVIMGNHRDAWVFGAVDPNSATAPLMEIARVFSELRNKGWRPGRTVMLCNWDAEEPALAGSTEWVEDKGKLLGAQTVAYLNLDTGVAGPLSLAAGASPLLYGVLFQATKMVKCPNPDFDTVYDQWLYHRNRNYNGTTKPDIGDLASGTDYTAFLQSYGIPCSSMAYRNRTSYGVYHSVHDNFYWMSQFGDPTFSHHLAVGLVWSKMAIMVATMPVLPYDPRDYGTAINRIYNNLEEEYGKILSDHNITLEYLKATVREFTQAATELWVEIENTMAKNLTSNQNIVRIINNKLLNLERAFIHPEGLPGRPYYKHVVFAPSSVNTYGSSVFPGISDAIFDAIHYGGSWSRVHRQIDIVRVHMRYASQILNYPTLKYI